MRIGIILSLLIIGLLLVAGCAVGPQTASGELTEEAGDADAVEQADEDLDSSELDDLDEELDDLSW